MIISKYPGLMIVASERSDGNMRYFEGGDADEVLRNRLRMAEAAGLGGAEVLRLHVSYERSDFTHFVKDPDVELYNLCAEDDVPVADGILVSDAGIALFLPLADCLGVVLYNPVRKHLMLLHAGRHTIEQDGVRLAVEFMVQNGSVAGDILVYFSPAAGAQNYPLHKYGGKGLTEVAREQLASAGICQDKVFGDEIDTTTDKRFWSNSQGDKTSRFGFLVRMTT